MAAAEDISLDVPEPQILLNFPGDANGFSIIIGFF